MLFKKKNEKFEEFYYFMSLVTQKSIKSRRKNSNRPR